jgi:hypothetical protein
MSRLVVAKQKAHRQTDTGSKVILFYISNIKVILSRGIKANKFSILYVVNKRHDITEHKNQQL